MNKIIITGHGKYGEAILSSLSMLSGNTSNIVAVDFNENDEEATLLEKYTNVITDENNYIFACDLLGGTPYKVAARLSSLKSNIKVVTGANVGGILDTNFKLEKLSFGELVDNIIVASKKNLSVLDLEKKEEVATDGI